MVRLPARHGSNIYLIGDFAEMGAPKPAACSWISPRCRRRSSSPPCACSAQPWEADASLQLRASPPRHRRHLPARRSDRRVEQRHRVRRRRRRPWADTAAGHRSLIVVDTTSDAADVSTRCQHRPEGRRPSGGHVADAAGDGRRIHIGDLLPAPATPRAPLHQRRPARASAIATCGPSPASTVMAHSSVKRDRLKEALVVLPAGASATYVVLGYATTIAGARGRTVDRGHVVVTPRHRRRRCT